MMETRRLGHAQLLVSAGLVVALMGCTDGAGSHLSTDDPTTPRTALSSSPLDGFLPLTDGDSEEAREAARVAEGLIAQCLKDQGFDYDEPYLSDQDIREGEGLSASEWAASYGYGYATSEIPEPEPLGDHRTPAETQAYLEALYGPDPGETADGEESVYDWTTQGCLGSAYHEATGGVDTLYGDEGHALILGEIDALTDIVDSAPEVLAVDEAWADCMADDGHPGLTKPSDARAQALVWWQDAGASSADAAVDTALDGEASDNAGAAVAPDEDPVGREIALAVVDVECQTAVDHAATVQQVRWQHEQGLVETYPSELAALRDAATALP